MELREPSARYAMAVMPAANAGQLPGDWDMLPLSEVAHFLDGLRRPVKDTDRAEMQGPIPYYGASGIVDYVNDFLFDDDLILLAEDGENILSRNSRIAFRVRGKSWVNNHAHVLKARTGISTGWLCEVLESLDYGQYNSGTAQPKLNKQTCLRIEIAVPPSGVEQEAIAAALGDADALIESLEQLLAKKRQLKQGAMQELLTGKRRLPGFSDGWEIVRLGQIGQPFGGLTGKSKKDFGHGSARYITFMNVIKNVVIDGGMHECVDVAGSEAQNRVARGDLLFNGSSETPEEVGLCALLNAEVNDLYLNSFCFGFRLRADIAASGLYLAYFFRSHAGRDLMRSLAQGATRYNLSKTALLRLQFQAPAAAEQVAIATLLSDLDTELEAIEAQLAKARHLKQGMAQALLTGRIRLV